jgi:hypothetical protein
MWLLTLTKLLKNLLSPLLTRRSISFLMAAKLFWEVRGLNVPKLYLSQHMPAMSLMASKNTVMMPCKDVSLS